MLDSPRECLYTAKHIRGGVCYKNIGILPTCSTRQLLFSRNLRCGILYLRRSYTVTSTVFLRYSKLPHLFQSSATGSPPHSPPLWEACSMVSHHRALKCGILPLTSTMSHRLKNRQSLATASDHHLLSVKVTNPLSHT